jgi:arginine decarboxylase
MLKPDERWHGFGNLADGFNMLDPIKATIITGLDVDGEFAEPASRRPSSPSTWPSTA